jgi:surface carbohydrate biosynthesis protein
MAPSKPLLILPVENLVRELDAKLLLACVAVERGLSCILGSRTEVDYCVGRFAPSIYFSKSMTRKSRVLFRILHHLGSEIVVQDEECMAYNSAEHYHACRLSPETLPRVATLFAWGRDSADLLRSYPSYSGTAIHTVGSPRVDLLRPELREFFEDDVRRIRERFGKFVLINSNFAMVNGFFDSFNVLKTPSSPGAEPKLGASGFGTTREFSKGYAAHRTALFEAFKGLLPRLGEAFPDYTFILRPHPSERREPWIDAARPLPNVHVVHEGNVIPWLLAADALIHNGCTTAVEAAVAGTPVVSFQPAKADPYDADLPNRLGRQATSVDELCEILRGVLNGEFEGVPVPGASRLLEEHLAALDGPLASDRILDVLEQSDAIRHGLPRAPVGSYLRGRIRSSVRTFEKRFIRARLPGHTKNPAYQEHCFPGVSIDELRARIARLSRVLHRFEHVTAEAVGERLFRIST